MTGAAQLIAEVRTFGGALFVNGDRLRIASDVPLPDELLSRVKVAKAEVLAALRYRTRWDAEDWRAYHGERAGIARFDGGLTDAETEASALKQCIVRWQALNPPADPGEHSCCHCGAFAGPDALVILAGDGGLRRVIHSRCHAPLLEASRAEAHAEISAALLQPKRQSP